MTDEQMQDPRRLLCTSINEVRGAVDESVRAIMPEEINR
jgi:hypothetical protein